MAQRQLLAPLLTQRFEARVPEAMRAHTRITFAMLGNDAGLRGAWHLAKNIA
jgi:hypothetical protein